MTLRHYTSPKRPKEALVQAHPKKPWLWKKAWANGIVRSSAAALAGPLLFAGVWTLFCVPLWFAVRSGTANDAEARLLWWLAVGFSATDLILIAWARRSYAATGRGVSYREIPACAPPVSGDVFKVTASICANLS